MLVCLPLSVYFYVGTRELKACTTGGPLLSLIPQFLDDFLEVLHELGLAALDHKGWGPMAQVNRVAHSRLGLEATKIRRPMLSLCREATVFQVCKFSSCDKMIHARID